MSPKSCHGEVRRHGLASQKRANCRVRLQGVCICACCIYRSQEAPGPRDCAAEALQQLPCHSLQARLTASLAAAATQPSSSLVRSMRHPSRSSCTATSTAGTSAVVSWPPPPPPPPLRRPRPQRSSDTTRGHFRRGDVFHGRHATSVVAGLRFSSPPGLVCNRVPAAIPRGSVNGGDARRGRRRGRPRGLISSGGPRCHFRPPRTRSRRAAPPSPAPDDRPAAGRGGDGRHPSPPPPSPEKVRRRHIHTGGAVPPEKAPAAGAHLGDVAAGARAREGRGGRTTPRAGAEGGAPVGRRGAGRSRIPEKKMTHCRV